MREVAILNLYEIKDRMITWIFLNDNLLKFAVVISYLLLVIYGATTSSIGISTLRENSQNPLGIQIGESSSIRADEYNAFSPIILSIMATAGTPTTSVLAAPAGLVHRYPSGGFFESFVFFDSTFLHSSPFLPDTMLFAAHWWLPVLFLFLFTPKWFSQVGAPRRWGWLAATLIALSPAASWWTMMPIQLIAYTIAGSSLMLSAYNRYCRGQRIIGSLLCIPAGILLAGMPSFYIPWSLVLGLPIFMATVAWILAQHGAWKPKLATLAVAGFVTVVFAAGTLWENRAGISALLDTVYPGSRRSTGVAQAFGMIFGAPALGALRDMSPIGSNRSELSTAFTITFVWAVILLVGIKKFGPLRDNVATVVIGLFGIAWLTWCTVNLGDLGYLIPLMNYVQPARAAQVCGIIGTVLVCLLLSRIPARVRWRLPAISAITCGLVTAYASSNLQQSYLPAITPAALAVVAISVGLGVFLVTRFPKKIWPIAVVCILAVFPVINTNPLIFGLGDLRVSTSATYMRSEGEVARDSGTLWASDLAAFDTLMVANGVPSLSGLQRSGPDKEQWAKLDPTLAHEAEWNRGGGFIYFEWIADDSIQFDNNGSDSPIVRADPCKLKELVPNLAGIASSIPLDRTCLKLDKTLEWSDKTMSIYRF